MRKKSLKSRAKRRDEPVDHRFALPVVGQGIEYVLLMDVGGSLPALRSFAKEVMPEFEKSPALA